MVAAAPSIRLSPEFLARYEILGEISAGGMGVVYRARQRSLDRDVAVKFSLFQDDELLSRFEAEAKVLAGLDHPYIVQVFDWGSDGSYPFLVQELIEGSSLADVLASQSRLPIDRSLSIARDLADALALIHSKGLVHRDLKPSNVLLAPTGPKVIDFGIVRAEGSNRTQDGVLLGTPDYMAPEMLQGQRAGPPADVYALGVILFECLTGRLPFDATEVQEILRMKLTQDAPAPSSFWSRLPLEVNELLAAMLHRDPASRPKSGRELIHAIVSCPTEEDETTLPMSAGTRVQKPHSSTRIAAAVPKREATQVSAASLPRPDRVPTRFSASVPSAAPSGSGAASVARKLDARPSRARAFSIAAGLLLLVVSAAAWLAWTSRGSIDTVPDAPIAMTEVAAIPEQEPRPDPRAEKLGALTSDLERAETAPDLPDRLEALYRVEETLDAARDLPVDGRRVEGLRTALLGIDRARLVATLTGMADGGAGGSDPLVRARAARDLRRLDPSSAAEHLASGFLAQNFLGGIHDVSVKARGEREARDRLLRGVRDDLLGPPRGKFWTAISPELPDLLSDPRVSLPARRKLLERALDTLGLRVLFLGNAMEPPVDLVKTLSPLVVWKARELTGRVDREMPLRRMLGLAGLEGETADLIRNGSKSDDYIHKDGELWSFGRQVEGFEDDEFKEREVLRSVELPPGGDPKRATAFVALVEKLHPADGFSLTLQAEGSGEESFEVRMIQPDRMEGRARHALLVLRIGRELVPAGRYGITLRACRLGLTHDITDTTRRVSRLSRLAAVAVP